MRGKKRTTRKKRIGKIGHRHLSYVQNSYRNKGNRDYNSPEYRAFRAAVKKRDGNKCQMPNCTSGKAIKVHHIIRWADAPSLRFVVSNGICLCRKCHDRITDKESYYIGLFKEIIRNKTK